MAAPEPIYDLVLMLDTSAPEDQRKKVLADTEAAISSGGSIVSDHDWGTRALAYEIRHRTDAEYHLLQFHGPATLLANLQRSLRIADGVLRFRIVKLAPGTPAPTELPRAEAPAAAPAPAAERSPPPRPRPPRPKPPRQRPPRQRPKHLPPPSGPGLHRLHGDSATKARRKRALRRVRSEAVSRLDRRRVPRRLFAPEGSNPQWQPQTSTG